MLDLASIESKKISISTDRLTWLRTWDDVRMAIAKEVQSAEKIFGWV